MTENIAYAGKDLESMHFASNYHRWLLSIFSPYLGKRVVEVGAGVGSFSELLIDRNITSLSLVEPARSIYQLLQARVAELARRSQCLATTTFSLT